MMDFELLRKSVQPPSEAMLKTIAEYQAGHAAGLAGAADDPAQPENWRQAWISGSMKRRVNAGEVIAVLMNGTHCKACDSVNYGNRMGCRCEGEIEWGVLLMSSDGQPAPFKRWDELRTARAGGMPVLDANTGLDLCLDALTE